VKKEFFHTGGKKCGPGGGPENSVGGGLPRNRPGFPQEAHIWACSGGELGGLHRGGGVDTL